MGVTVFACLRQKTLIWVIMACRCGFCWYNRSWKYNKKGINSLNSIKNMTDIVSGNTYITYILNLKV